MADSIPSISGIPGTDSGMSSGAIVDKDSSSAVSVGSDSEEEEEKEQGAKSLCSMLLAPKLPELARK